MPTLADRCTGWRLNVYGCWIAVNRRRASASAAIAVAARGVAQHFVAGVVTERAVHALVVVEIEQQQGGRLARRVCLLLRVTHFLDEGGHVREARQVVVMQLMLEARFRRAPARHVEARAR